MPADQVIIGDDGIGRCGWGDAPEIYRTYHDTEWGFPVTADVRLFEKLALEGFQSGLSWLTILRKRENFRAAFDGFDFRVVAEYGDDDVIRLLADAGIVRHRGKIEATINNAARAVEMVAAEGSIAQFVWRYEPAPGPVTRPGGPRPPASSAGTFTPGPGAEVASESDASRALAKELKRRGWRFVGPITVHSFIQAMGLVNEHVEGCAARAAVDAARAAFVRPGPGQLN